MNLKEMIYRRKSVRSYTGEPVEAVTLRKIEAFAAGLKPLYPGIRVRCEIVDRSSVKCILPWITPQLLAIFTEDREGAPENVGFMFQQMELCLQSLGLSACWLGMGRIGDRSMVKNAAGDGLKFSMLIAFGHPSGSAQRKSPAEFKRKPLTEISDRADERLEPARLAPSSVNSQPWQFTHEGEAIHVHCASKGVFRVAALSEMNRIDMGIALAHMYIANPESFRFFKSENAASPKGCQYIGSFTL